MKKTLRFTLLLLWLPLCNFGQTSLDDLMLREHDDSNKISIAFDYLKNDTLSQQHITTVLLKLKRISTSSNNLRQKILILNKIARTHPIYDSSLQYIQTSIELSKDLPYLQKQSRIALIHIHNKNDEFLKATRIGKKVLSSLKNNRTINYYNICKDIGRSYYYIGKIDSANLYFHITKANAKYRNDSSSLCKSIMNIAVMFDVSGSSDSAIHYYKNAASIAHKINDERSEGQIHMNMGTYYMERNDIVKSISESHKASEIFIKLDDHYNIVMNYENLAMAYLSRKKFKNSLTYIEKSGEIIKSHKLKSLEPIHFKTLCNYYDEKKEEDSTLKYLRKVSFGFLEINRNCDASQYLHSYVSRILSHNKSIPDSTRIMNLLDTLDQNCSDLIKALNKYTKAEIAQFTGNYAKSITILLEILPFFIDGQYAKTEMLVHNLLSLAYAHFHDYKNAHTHASKVINLKDSVYQLELDKEVNLLELEITNRENHNLTLEKELNSKTIDHQNDIIKRKNTTTSILIALFFSMAISLIILLYFRSKTIAKNSLLKKKNDQISQQNNLLIDNKRDDDNILSVVAHDLSSPIRSIIGLCDLINDEKDTTPYVKEYVGYIHESAKTGLSLSSSLLSAKQHIDTSKSKHTKLDITKILTIIKAINKNFFYKKHIDFTTDISPNLVLIQSEVSFTRVIDNLISNALKFTPPHGVIQLKAYKKDNYLRIEITDSGPGFTEHDLKYAFQPFTKLSAKPTNNEKSTGLGLYIVKKLVAEMNGKIEINSSKNKGATFILTFFSS